MNRHPHKKRLFFITDWGSVTFYSKAVQAALYSINGHPPPIAEDRLTEGYARSI